MIEEKYIPFREYQTYVRIVKEDDQNSVPILLLHGGPGSTHNYFEVLDPLAKQRPVISYDQLGCGNSYVDHHPELWTLSTWMEELDNVIKSLHLTRFHLLGQSWGGMLALAYALQQPQGLQSLILSSTLSSSQLWGREQHRMLKYMTKEEQDAITKAEETGNWQDEMAQKAIARYMKLHCADIKDNDPECLRREKRSGTESYMTAWGPNELTPQGTLKNFDVTDKLCEIKVPCLIISGTDDLCTPLIAKTMYDHLPYARWELFANARHMVFAEYTEKYLQLLADWCQETDTGMIRNESVQ
ncbi:MAG: proline iminopeptidase-family hydrolase [Lactimicrobium massiliense]|nr:proline iminopeptidase-family hydrolase [Lactimicrobium massiliense]MDD6230393.1 proline iminopeptidase-family hydrolase [Lactimicrobium massiliense]